MQTPLRSSKRFTRLAVLALLFVAACSSAPEGDAEGAVTSEGSPVTVEGSSAEPVPAAAAQSCTSAESACFASCGTTRCALICTLAYKQCVSSCAQKRTACYPRCGNDFTCSVACSVGYEICVGR